VLVKYLEVQLVWPPVSVRRAAARDVSVRPARYRAFAFSNHKVLSCHVLELFTAQLACVRWCLFAQLILSDESIDFSNLPRFEGSLEGRHAILTQRATSLVEAVFANTARSLYEKDDAGIRGQTTLYTDLVNQRGQRRSISAWI
jgi:hypothetical protein